VFLRHIFNSCIEAIDRFKYIKINICISGVDDKQVIIFIQFVYHKVINHSAALVAEHCILGAFSCEVCNLICQSIVQKPDRIASRTARCSSLMLENWTGSAQPEKSITLAPDSS